MHQPRNRFVSWMVMLGILVSLFPTQAGPAEEFRTDILPILKTHCYDCHGAGKQKADLNLETFTDYAQVTGQLNVWQLVSERVLAFEMPPSGRPELPFSQHQKLGAWLRALPRPDQVDCEQIASDRNTSFYKGYVMSRRLNRAEYNATVRDLIGLDLHLQDLLPADGGGGEGFDTTGSALFVSPIHVEKYLAAADRVIAAIFDGTVPGTGSEVLLRLLVATPSSRVDAREAARRVLQAFGRRAFRRPVSGDEVGLWLTLFDRGWKRGDGYERSLRLPFKAILISPNFLFLAEPEPAEGGVRRLASLPLASRLSYFLWSSMPDDELLALAENDELRNDAVYRGQVRRMLADPKAQALGERFVLQWLDLDRLGQEVRPDAKQFPEFDDELCAAMKQEVTAFFNRLIRDDRSLLELIESDFTIVNQRLAALYGIEGVTGDQFQVVPLPDQVRGGIIGMAAVHTVTSYPTRTSPVLRGRWVLESLLGEKVNPPPPDVPALELDAPDVARRTLREQLQVHRGKAECASCHEKMDPLGFGLENFDVLGRWREKDRGQAIDAEGTLPSGQKFVGPPGLRAVLVARKDDVMKHLVRKMSGFAYGRELNQHDECAVDRVMRALQANQYRASILIEQIASSFPFRHRFYPKQS